MIGPGWMPGLARQRGPRRLTLAYTRMRRRSQRRAKNAPTTPSLPNTDLVLFDGPAELPIATAVPHEPRARAIALAASLQRWLAARWQWFKPRTVPCAVAALGMLAVIEAADYLAQEHAESSGTHVVHVVIAPR